MLADYASLSIATWPIDAQFRGRILQPRHNLSAYDAAYVTLAEALDATLVTRDARLERGAPPGARVRLA